MSEGNVMRSMEQYRREAAEQEEAFAKARRQREREERRERDKNSAVELLRAEMQVELSVIQSRIDAIGEATGEALAEYSDKAFEHIDNVIKKTQSELFVLVERRFGEIMGRIDAIAGGESRARSQPRD